MPKLCDEGENLFADILFDAHAVVASLWIGLYENTTEPAEDDVMTDITEQAVATGYGRIELVRGTWVITGSEAEYPQVTFTASGGDWGNQYGYFITDAETGTAGLLIAVEQFADGPYNVGDGDSVKITAKITVS